MRETQELLQCLPDLQARERSAWAGMEAKPKRSVRWLRAPVPVQHIRIGKTCRVAVHGGQGYLYWALSSEVLIGHPQWGCDPASDILCWRDQTQQLIDQAAQSLPVRSHIGAQGGKPF